MTKEEQAGRDDTAVNTVVVAPKEPADRNEIKGMNFITLC